MIAVTVITFITLNHEEAKRAEAQKGRLIRRSLRDIRTLRGFVMSRRTQI
jgi:hypothetical protein